MLTATRHQCLTVSEESMDLEEKSEDIIKFPNDFYEAIMDEDLTLIGHMLKKYGINFPIKVKVSVLGDNFCWGSAILPLHLAASYRRLKSMQSLLSAGADPELRDRLGRTTLHLLITSWPKTFTCTLKPDSKAAKLGVCTKAKSCLQLLCEHGVNVNAEVEKSQQTALHLSVRYTAVSAVHILARHGADVNAVDVSGMTPLHMAIGKLHRDIMASLIKEGADVNVAVSHSGNTPLHLVVVAVALKSPKSQKNYLDCVSLLLEHGADINACNKAGMTALQEVCTMGNEELVDLLLRHGANVNTQSKAGENCLFLFLNHRQNVTKSSLLGKLFSLISPLTLYNRKGHLPLTLMLPCFFKQREQLLRLIQQPRKLQDMCKSVIYVNHTEHKREELRKILPEKLYDFIFVHWENPDISFATDDKQDLFHDSTI